MVNNFRYFAIIVLAASSFLEPPIASAQQKGQEAADSSQFIFIESDSAPPASFLRFSASLHDYYNALANNSNQIVTALNKVGELYPVNTEIELKVLSRCLEAAHRGTSKYYFNTNGAYENSFVVTDVQMLEGGISMIEYSHSHVALGKDTQHSEINRVYVSEKAILGNHPDTSSASAQCWNSHTQLSINDKAAYQKAISQPTQPTQPTQSDEPIVSTGQNKWDLITSADPSLFECLVYKGRVRDDIFDKRVDDAVMHENVYKYMAYYKDGTLLEIRAHPEYETEELARDHASNISFKVGQLPRQLRADIQRIALMRGDNTAMGDGGGEGIHLQTGNAALRESHNRLEETLFHEAVHTSVDDLHANRIGWLNAQKMDKLFLTQYGRQLPDREDLAETLLYVYALIYHPERIPEKYREILEQRIPNRVAYIKKNIFNTTEPLGVTVNHSNECGKT